MKVVQLALFEHKTWMEKVDGKEYFVLAWIWWNGHIDVCKVINL